MTRVLARALLRPMARGMNRLEATYADQLEARRLAGQLREWHFEAVTLKLADDTRYTPDFLVIGPDGAVAFHEVKGFMRDDAHVKIKVAARLFPFGFYLVRKAKHGYFDITDYSETT